MRRLRGDLRRATDGDLSDLHGTLRLIPMHQPSGFRTTYRQEDFDDENDESAERWRARHIGEWTTGPRVTIEGTTLLSYDQAQLVQVNDNNGALFPLAKDSDGSYLVTDPSLFPDVKGWPPKLRRSRRSPLARFGLLTS